MNNATIIGNLTRDPELAYTESQKAVCKFTVAVNRFKEGTDYIRIVAWNRQAENCNRYLKKGRKVAVNGEIRTGSYKKDGMTIPTFEIWANNVEFLNDGGTGFAEVEETLPF